MGLALVGASPVAGADGDARTLSRDQVTATRPLIEAAGFVAFSPNGDHRQDRGRTRFRLSEPARVTVTVRNRHGAVVLRVQLGRLPGGRHVWTWDGRRGNGGLVPDNDYEALLRAVTATRAESPRTIVRVDTVRPQGHLVTTRPTVHPRASVVEDHVQLVWLLDSWSPSDEEFWPDERLARSRMEIRTPAGELVWRRTVRDSYTPVFDWYGRRPRGGALPAGRYVARVTVTDTAGNRRRDKRNLRVSHAQLVEEVWTETVAAARGGTYEPYFGGCNGCYDFCGPVASDRFPDGLSFRPCPSSQIVRTARYFGSDVPFPVAPVDSYRVTASGGPTTPGSAAVGQLGETTLGPGDASATTPWTAVDLTGDPFLPARNRPVVWEFHTYRPSSYDVATFTVDYRHYVPAD